MKYIFDKVKEFNKAFGIDIKAQSKELRYDLFKEEADEYLNALNDVDRADAIADMLYIWAGTVLKHGKENSGLSIIETLNNLKRKEYKKMRWASYYSTHCFLSEWNDRYLNSNRIGCSEYTCLQMILQFILQAIISNRLQMQILLIFNAVHESNMAKLGTDGKPIINGQNGVLYPGKPLNKVMKPEGWKDPKENIFKILSEN
jgi:hypothetical protein